MHISDFDPSTLAGGTKTHLPLEVCTTPDGGSITLTLLAVIGAEPGPTFVVTAGVHGDEYEGIHAILKTYRSLNPEDVGGSWLAVPVANPPAYTAVSRTSPIDGMNLARIFPGDADGTPSQRIAHYLTHKVIAHADLFLDLHSAGMDFTMPTVCGYHLDDGDQGRASRQAALAFGIDVVWGHPGEIAPGRSLSAATELGIPWIYTETTGGRRALTEDVNSYIRGIQNVMKHLGMLIGGSDTQAPRYDLAGDGNLEKAIAAKTSGFFVSDVSPLDEVKEGDVLGHILNMTGEVIEEIQADRDGVVILMRGLPMIHAGEGTFVITGRL